MGRGTIIFKMSAISRFASSRIKQISTIYRQHVRPIMTNEVQGPGGTYGKMPIASEWDTKFSIQPTRWTTHKARDDMILHWIIWGGPFLPIGMGTSLFIGDAKLTPIPEGYEPREEEYEPNPITRYRIKYWPWGTKQQSHEVRMHRFWEVHTLGNQLALKMEVRRLMKQDGDYKGGWFMPFSADKDRLFQKQKEEYKLGKGVYV